jgi:hypothetical protein
VKKVVWARGSAFTEECPTSFIEPRSVEWMEKFFAWNMGGGDISRFAAKDADALLLIQKEWRELKNGV